MLAPPAQTRQVLHLVLPIPDLYVVQVQPRFHLRPNQTAVDRIQSSVLRGSDSPSPPSPAPAWPIPFVAPATPLITAISSANRARRPAFRCTNRSFRNCRYSTKSAKSRLPRSSSALFHRSLKPMMTLLGVAVFVRTRRVRVQRPHPVIPHHSFHSAGWNSSRLLMLFTALDRLSVRCSDATAPNSHTAFCHPSLRLSRLSE